MFDDPITKLEKKLGRARAASEAADQAHGEAALDAELSAGATGALGAEKKLATAQRALERARAQVGELEGALRAAERRESERQATEAQDNRRERWSVALGHAKARKAVAKDVEAAVSTLANCWDSLVQASVGMHTAVTPNGADLSGAMVQSADLERLLRLEFRKHGWTWAAPGWVWGTDAIPPLAGEIEKGNDFLARQAAK